MSATGLPKVPILRHLSDFYTKNYQMSICRLCKLCNWTTGHKPVQNVSAHSSQMEVEMLQGRPVSGMLATLRARHHDQSTSHALGNIMRAISIRDGATLVSLAKITLDDSGTAMDVCPVIRLWCVCVPFLTGTFMRRILHRIIFWPCRDSHFPELNTLFIVEHNLRFIVADHMTKVCQT